MNTPSKPTSVSEKELIPLSVPTIRGNEWNYIKECLDTGWVSSVGPFVEQFEKKVANFVNAGFGVATVNGTAGTFSIASVAEAASVSYTGVSCKDSTKQEAGSATGRTPARG